MDSDSDTLSDYIEDANGNDTTDSGESSIAYLDSDYDGRSDPEERTEGTDPLVATDAVLTRLAYFPFNDTSWLGSAGQAPMASSNAVSKDAWLTKGLSIDTNTTAFLRYRDVEASTAANINLRNGAVRFWFRTPAWDTGGAPGTNGTLIEVGQKGEPFDATNGWWALHFNTNGTQLIFSSETNGLGASYLTGMVSWLRCDWNQVVLNYTPTNSALYLNGSLVTNGLGVSYWPEASLRSYGLHVGSDILGNNLARGLFEDLETFNYPLSANEIALNFETNRPPNAIANLKMWLKADAGIETNTAPDRVRIWRDQTCNTNDANQINVPSQQPYFVTNAINGLPVVQFRANEYLVLPVALTNTSEAEGFVVLRCKTNTPTGNRGLWRIGSQGNIYPSTQGEIEETFASGRRSKLGIPLDLTNAHLFNIVSGSSEWSASLNGVIRFSRSPNSVVFHQTPLLGQGANATFDGDVAELLFYGRALSWIEREAVSRYLNAKYALITNAPGEPTNLSGSAISPSQISLWWTALPSTNRTTFLIERKIGSFGTYTCVATNVDNWSFIDTNLASGTEYFYRLKASNLGGESQFSNETNITTLTLGSNAPLDLVLWLKADAGVPLSKDRIPMWFDQSGRGNHGEIGPSSSGGPFVTNATYGRPIARFNGAEATAHPNGTFSNLTSAEVFTVLKGDFDASGGDNGLWQFGGGGGDDYPYFTSKIDEDFGSSTDHFVGYATNVILTSYHLLNISSASNRWIFRKNGTVFTDDNVNTVAFTALPPLLGKGQNNHFYGNIHELLIYPRVLTTNERAAVELYLNSKHFP